jgi:hypothetical protein
MIPLLFIFCNSLNAQNNESLLVGRSYSKSANSSEKTILKFKDKKQGVLESSAELLGKVINVSMNFSYIIKGTKLNVIYEDGQGEEEYIVDDVKKQLVSTHLQGYVDGKWGKIYWKRVN